MGRLDKQMSEFFSFKKKYKTINGIGATPEAIEQMPVLYDNLYELPWMESAPESAEAWLRDYSIARYGQENANAQAAWEQLRTTALNCMTDLQGPHEAVYCSRPSLTVNAVSAWGEEQRPTGRCQRRLPASSGRYKASKLQLRPYRNFTPDAE